ncbi:MAG: flavodoxin-dependent (E)-4-hydroxy-3-methylbut-2-enyl-diphosphate synthase [Brevinematales bacterium]|jgi:(E)-4-hydroxy-3-methylbut-2-enyl-diphosphate synthase
MSNTGRKNTRQVTIGKVKIGGLAPVSVQSMTTVGTDDINAVARQIKRLKSAGCDIVRLGIPDLQSALAVREIKKKTDMPLVADIHFDYRLALQCVECGIDALRINPGNLRGPDEVKEVARACLEKNIPIRIGVNGGSIDKSKFGSPGAQALVDSAIGHIRLLEKEGFNDIKVSLKSSDVKVMVEAYRIFSEIKDYPLHLGVTEAGAYDQALIKSSAGIGTLLLEGIGDTIRISITGDPVKEVEAANTLLRVLGLRNEGIEIISCPMCARHEFDVERVVNSISKRTKQYKKYMKVAVMGCVVNGPGEAAGADIGIAVGAGGAVLFRKGVLYKKINKGGILKALLNEIELFQKES